MSTVEQVNIYSFYHSFYISKEEEKKTRETIIFWEINESKSTLFFKGQVKKNRLREPFFFLSPFFFKKKKKSNKLFHLAIIYATDTDMYFCE